MTPINETEKRFLNRALDILKECEPSMEHLGTFYSGFYPVLHVKYQGIEYIFKSALRILDNELLPNEARILRDLKDVKGITHLIQTYKTKKHLKAILKEFFPGRKLGAEEKIKSELLQKKLEDTIREIHEAGYAQLDIHEGNIIISYDQEDVCFVDPIQELTRAENSERKRDRDKCLLRRIFYQPHQPHNNLIHALII